MSECDTSKPNIILIFTDDLGYNDLSVQGSKTIHTPYLDQMAAEGIRFTNFHAQPVCGPSRAAIMTGCYPQRVGQVGNKRVGIAGGHPLIHPKEITIAETLRKEGYGTHMIGKWHLGLADNNSPTEMGFDSFYGTPGSNDGLWADKTLLHFDEGVDPNAESDEFPEVPLIRDTTVVEYPMMQTGITTRYTDEAIKIIEESKEENKPFFLYLAHNMPHVPLHPSENFVGKSKYGVYGDCVEEIDWNTGRIIETLKKNGLDDDTLVIFTSDNGPWLRPNLIEKKHCGSAYPLRGGKVMSWEGGFRVPCIMRMPSLIPKGQINDELVNTLDMFPTFAHLAGTVCPGDRKLDGEDISDILMGKSNNSRKDRAFYFYVARNLQAVQRGKWKLILTRPPLPEMMDRFWASHFESIDSPELYNLDKDIGESKDISSDYPDIVAELMELANDARRELGEGPNVGKGERFWESFPLPGDAELDNSWESDVSKMMRKQLKYK